MLRNGSELLMLEFERNSQEVIFYELNGVRLDFVRNKIGLSIANAWLMLA